jgi:hypothetical protein
MTDQEHDTGTMYDSSGEPIPSDLELFLQADYERDDERWSIASQVRDWLILFAIGVVVFLWMFLVFLLEPGIR